jgi:hypothetical protein
MAKTIPLTRGEVAVVDDEEYEFLNQFSWRCLIADGKKYAYGYVNKKDILMHRLIMNAPPTLEVDHINGDGLYNLKSNMRICTRTQNGRNTCLPKNNTSGHKGVRWIESRRRWMARIKVNRKSIFLGHFRNFNDAVSAYETASLEYFGEFARKNTGEAYVTFK